MFYTIQQVCAETNFTRQHIYSQIKEGTFPRGIKWGRAVRWPDFEIKAIFDARLAEKTKDELRELVNAMHTARTRAQQPAQAAQEGGLA